jgi:hypothetical protein
MNGFVVVRLRPTPCHPLWEEPAACEPVARPVDRSCNRPHRAGQDRVNPGMAGNVSQLRLVR